MIENFIESSEPMKKSGKGRKKQPIICLQNGSYFESTSEAGMVLSVGRQNITMALKGKRGQAKGYTFRYATDEEIKIASVAIH